MKNHIKNCIKIMGLAAVPFGTAQATDYEIKVTQEYQADAMIFKIRISEKGGKNASHMAEIVWPHDKDCPDPMCRPNGFSRMYHEELRTKMETPWGMYGFNTFANVLEFCHFHNAPERLQGKRAYTVEEALSMFTRDDYTKTDKLSVHWKIRLATLKELVKQKKRGMDYVEGKGKECIEEDVRRLMREKGITEDEARKEWLLKETCPRLELPAGCTYAAYQIMVGGEELLSFFLVRDKNRSLSSSVYTLILCFSRDFRNSNISVLSDVPTVCFC